MFTPEQVVQMMCEGRSLEDITAAAAVVSSPVAAPAAASPKAGAPAFIVEQAQRKAERRSLAAALRIEHPGIDFTTDAGRAIWAKAKADAGLTKREKAAAKAAKAAKKAKAAKA